MTDEGLYDITVLRVDKFPNHNILPEQRIHALLIY